MNGMSGSRNYNRKPIPKSILIFGAADHIGDPLAAFLTRDAPSIRLRLATRNADKAKGLRLKYPAAEVVLADYTDLSTLVKAVEGMEGIFVVTPGGLDERACMTNLIAAVKASGSLIHMLRITGLHPDESLNRVPRAMRLSGDGIEIQHVWARQILDESGLPVTFLNCGATFMDNFIRLGLGDSLRRQRKLIWPEHLVPWIDPRDIAEVAACLFLSDNHRHIGHVHTMNNGHDLMRYHEVAKLMSETWNEPIAYDGSKEAFFATYSHLGPLCQHLWDYMQYEQDNEVVWARNDFVERTIGRKPTTLLEWLVEHRDMVLNAAVLPDA
ncbi:NmrA family NAD(P)-binding protein [Sphingopyxis sp. GC21]|uniref:NmrA family NAD(P)-binding protein n=1 Tax=Sphingopyxis sp. GC21 TaxID=2933562 RepID=UPI0021E4FA56|nr:NmrA family NAD(P)-binding protein [Sphingopyxis sp. GC21]